MTDFSMHLSMQVSLAFLNPFSCIFAASDQISRLLTMLALSQLMTACHIINFIIRNTIIYNKSADINKTIKRKLNK